MKQLKKNLLGLMITLCVALSMPALLSQLGATSMIAQAATLSSKKVTLIKDTKKTLKLSGAKGGVTWSTSNKSIATVSSKGVVTAKSAGTATITATNKNQKYTCTVIVEAPKLSNTKLTVKNGTTATLKLDGTTQTVKWSTSNKSIATVSSKGVVTAKKVGSVTISAKVGGKTYKCKVNVQAVPVKLSNTSLSLEVGGTFDLKITGATGTVKWSSNKTSVATVSSSGKVTAKKAGTATITATVSGKKYTCKVTVKEKKKEKYGSVSGNITYLYNNFRGHVPDTNSDILLIPRDGTAKNMPTLSSYVNWDARLIKYEGNAYKIYGAKVDGMGTYTLQNIPTGDYLLVVISNKTTSGLAFDNKSAYEKYIANIVSPCISKSNAEYFAKYVGYSKYMFTTITVKENQNTIYSYDFGITYL